MPDLSQRLQEALAGRYRIERELGRGGMATVLLAEDLKHRRPVALKVLDPEVAAAIGPERFLREIETVAKLNHPHVLTLHDSGQADGLLFYVMPYVTGESLRQRIERDRQLPLDDALQITREVADALDHAHRQGVVHRDIKPENILLEEGHALVADFGIARAVAEAGGEKLTATGVVIGTPAYMSPEQAGGSTRLDGRSDEYSLGCVLYEMLAGQPPFTGPTVESLVHQHLSVQAPPVTAVRRSVPGGVERALAKALVKTPADRYGTPGEFAAALERGRTEPEPRPPGRGALWVAAGAILIVAALTAVAWWQAWGPFAGKAAPPGKKDWILVAEFDSAPEDSMVAMASRDLLSAALDQSRIVQTVPRGQIAEALVAAGKPLRTRVDAEVARELAHRSAVRAVLEGTIGRLGRGYSIVLKVVDADTSRVILTRSGTAKNDDDLIPVLGEMAKQLRRGLGENQQALKATRPMRLVVTPSFEAYQLFLEARVKYGRNQFREAIRLYRAAIDLDPQFASAWGGMVYTYYYMGFPDSAFLCLDEQFRHPDRLTRAQRREGPEEVRAFLQDDFERQLATQERRLADDPNDVAALSYSDPLWAVGRMEEALEHLLRARSLSPFPPADWWWGNVAGSLTRLGRYDEAREADSHVRGNLRFFERPDIELAAGRYAVAESLAIANGDDPSWVQDNPDRLLWALAQARLGRGDGAAAARAFQEGIEILRSHGEEGGYRRTWLEYAVVSGGAVPLPPNSARSDTSMQAVVTKGLKAVVTNDTTTARRCLEAARRRGRIQVFNERVALALLQARLEAMAGRPAEALRLLRSFDKVLGLGGGGGASVTWAHWWLADAFEQIGQPDSAAFYLERTFRVAFSGRDGPLRPCAHWRLALLYARMGKIPDAERHLAAAEKAWDRPDPAVRRMLDEARSAVRASRGVARPAPGRS